MRFLPSIALFLAAAPIAAAQVQVAAISPARHALQVDPRGEIRVEFDAAVDPASVPPLGAGVRIGGQESGVASGTWTLDGGGSVLRFEPAVPFLAGEVVTVLVTEGVQAAAGGTMSAGGYVQRFTVAASPANMDFELVETINVRTDPNVRVRVYGGQACDFDGDGWTDMGIVNEDSSDVRVLLSEANAGGSFEPFLVPTNPVGSTPSPNHNADLDGDGLLDLVTGNTQAPTVSVLIGNGDGTFQPRVDYTVGQGVRGLALLDADGDGDMDIAACSFSNGHVAVLLNDGAGQFGSLTTFDGGGSGEFGLASGDMNEDGIDDLIVGMRTSQRLAVHLGQGDGTFVESDNVNCGGSVWMIVMGDVNGDGHLDASTANGASASGSILLGDGQGNLTLDQVQPMQGFSTATDLGDLDGDGDLDWVVSEFGGDVWELFENQGPQGMVFRQAFDAPDSPGCALIFDMDQDGDLDLALLDELSDDLLIHHNVSPGTTLCLGDGSNGVPCPCGNESAGGQGGGCANSTGSGGLLLASGSASVGADDLTLAASRLPAGQFGLIFSGTMETELPFGDGLRCLGGTLVRFGAQPTGANGELSLAAVASAGRLAPGDTRWFQGWVRDPVMGACGGGFTTTSALQVTFLP